MVNELTGGDLNVGVSYLHVEVEHCGSDSTEFYDWFVDFLVIDFGGLIVTTDNMTICDAVESAYPLYGPLGVGQGASM
jgi:hypothetical protein